MSQAPPEQPREHRDAVALLADAAARARSGAGGLVLLRGATGTGRTTVLGGVEGFEDHQDWLRNAPVRGCGAWDRGGNPRFSRRKSRGYAAEGRHSKGIGRYGPVPAEC